MRNANRIDSFCDELKEIWKKVPDWRFFQLMNNFQRYIGSDGFYLEEDKALQYLKEFISEFEIK